MGKKVTRICFLLFIFGLSSVASDEILKCRKEIKNAHRRPVVTCYVDVAVREKGEILSEPIDTEISTLTFTNNNTKYLPDNVAATLPNLQTIFAYCWKCVSERYNEKYSEV
ncbi:CLUMA_CG004515, isoform A [Clunio marinus]|uniref:CLUMA_CG004515, isoform A n=1 Tax=Clunio marinus TaxID=568069 RepID=A0A1J1HXF9_9DIPT|nr:CLUMA_CG004515, isoform A [Clunio marinus]